MSIHQEMIFPVSPERVFELLLDGGEFGKATGQPAEIEPNQGGIFSVFGGKIEGRQVELVPGVRIVQAWRGSDWEAGKYSMVRFTLVPERNCTRVVLDQEGYPEGASPMFATWHEHLSIGWKLFYFEPIGNYFGAVAA